MNSSSVSGCVAAPASVVDGFAQTLSEVYTSSENERRRAAVLHLGEMENRLAAGEILEVGVGLLQTTSHGVAVQAYGTVMLYNALRAGRLAAHSIPYAQLLSWFCDDATLQPLILCGLQKLLVLCLLCEWPERFPDLLNIICSENIAHFPRKVELLRAFVDGCVNIPIGLLPSNRIGLVKRKIVEDGRPILQRVNQALFEIYTAAGGEGSTQCVHGTEVSVASLLSTVELLGPLLSMQQWWELNLDATLSTLVRWPPSRKDAISAAVALLQSDSVNEGLDDQRLGRLLSVAIRDNHLAVARKELDIVENTLQLLMGLPEKLLVSASAAVSQAIVEVLSIPSVLFAVDACEVLKRLRDQWVSFINPLDLLERLLPLASKEAMNMCKLNCSHSGAANLALEQYGSQAAFETGFAEFRGLASGLIERVATHFPVVSTQYVLRLIKDLPPPVGSTQEPRTPYGCVTQQGPTFAAWEVTHFMVSHLSGAFKLTNDCVLEAFRALASIPLTDKVITPVYLNLLSAFWGSGEPQIQEELWVSSFSFINTVIDTKERIDLNDLDAISARKRGCTLLINACTNHSMTLARFTPRIFGMIEPLLVSGAVLPTEKALLYEAAAALTNALPDAESESYLRTILGPMERIICDVVGRVDQAGFNSIIFPSEGMRFDGRSELRDCLNVVAAIFRRCRQTQYIVERSAAILPLLTRLVDLIHGIKPEDIPERYITALDLDPAVRRQLLQRKAHPGNGPPVEMAAKARNALNAIRLAVYQSIGLLAKFVPAESITEVLQQLLSGAARLPIHSMRHLTEQCLFHLGRAYPVHMPRILPVLVEFFSLQSQQPRSLQDEVADSRQLFFFAREVFAFLRGNILDSEAVMRSSPMLLTLTLRIALEVLRCGEACRDSAQLILAHLKDIPSDDAMRLFGEVAVIVSSPESRLAYRDRLSVCGFLSDVYLGKYPAYVPALHMSGMPQEKVDELNAHLTIAPRPNVKRRRFSEFLLQNIEGAAGSAQRGP